MNNSEVMVESEVAKQACNAAHIAYDAYCHLSTQERLSELCKLKEAILKDRSLIIERVMKEVGKCRTDALIAEILGTVDWLDWLEKNAVRLLRPERVKTPITLLGKQSMLLHEPLGVVLIICPWNYPFHNAITGIAAAIVTGNAVVYKPSEHAPCVGLVEQVLACSPVLQGLVQVVYGDGRLGAALIEEQPAKIFFTGSGATGSKIMAQASQPWVIESECVFNGDWVPASGRWLPINEPATGEVLMRSATADAADIAKACHDAAMAQPSWAALGPRERATFFRKAADVAEQSFEELALYVARETGAALFKGQHEVCEAIVLLHQAASLLSQPYDLWNGKNDDPSASFGEVSDTQAGQALHANLTVQYALTEQLSAGLNGYWLKQITDTQVDGHDVSGRREKVWAIGPGLVYAFRKEDVLSVNAYFEQDAENRTEGDKLVLNWLHKF